MHGRSANWFRPRFALLPDGFRSRLDIVQQCRPEDIESRTRGYAAAGVKAELASFYNDLPARMAKAHLVIARAGAGTVSETDGDRPACDPDPAAARARRQSNPERRNPEQSQCRMVRRAGEPDAGKACRHDQARLLQPPTIWQSAPRTRMHWRDSTRCRVSPMWRKQLAGAAVKPGQIRVPLDIGAIHFIGVGGIGMSGIAEIMHNLGYKVRGLGCRRRTRM